jgi:aminodeoxyfutalosine synthase
MALRRLPERDSLGEGGSPTCSVKAYTAVEIDFFCRLTKQPAEWVLERLREVGLDALPGGGAEVFSERVRREIFQPEDRRQRWIEIHEIAHRMGILPTARCSTGTSRRARSGCST